jgi:glycosyltransferase involved in cell wall biosynthesis
MNTYAPKVSVCVVTYNQEKYIADCLRSIVEQTVEFDYEVIVSDDFSTDGTREIIKAFAEKYPAIVKPVLHDVNLGPYRNFIDTHNRARGDYVAHCDGDDLFAPNKLELQAKYLDAHSTCSLVYGRALIFNDQGLSWENAANVKKVFPDSKFYLSDLLRMGTIGIHSSQMYRRSCRRTRDPLYMALDYYYALEYLRSGYGYYFNEVLTHYRLNHGAGTMTTSTLGQRRNKRLMANYLRMYLKLLPGCRSDVFIGALTFALIDLKHLRRTAFHFLSVAMAALVWISPRRFFANLRHVSYFKTRFKA